MFPAVFLSFPWPSTREDFNPSRILRQVVPTTGTCYIFGLWTPMIAVFCTLVEKTFDLWPWSGLPSLRLVSFQNVIRL